MSTRPLNGYLAYLATPYSRYPLGIEQAFMDAAKLAALLMRMNIHVYSPIAHTHPLAVYGRIDPLDHAIWMPFDKMMMDKADVLIVAHMDGWQDSRGVAEEIAVFERAGKPIYDLDPRTLMMTRRQEERAGGMTVVAAIARIAELDKAIAEYPSWGAALTAMDEERKELASFVSRNTPTLAHKKTPAEHAGTLG